jgi:hypothetical protein
LRAEVAVCEGDSLAVVDSETVVHAVDYFWRCGSSYGPTPAVVDWLVVNFLVGCLHHAGEILATTLAGIYISLLKETIKEGAVKFCSPRLRDHRWLPIDAEPYQIFDHGFYKLLTRALRIEILVAQQ